VDAAAGLVTRARHVAVTPERLAVERLMLRSAAQRFFRVRLAEVDDRRRDLTAARAPAPREIDRWAARLTLAARRRHAAAEDWTRAFDRLERQRGRAASRTLEGRSAALARAADRVCPAASRVLRRTSVEVEHLTRLVAAKDFRPRGWVLASDAAGRALASAAAISPGDPVALRFADGSAEALVSSVHHRPQEAA
jgi:exodeoxyribonuclease VII large subunit